MTNLAKQKLVRMETYASFPYLIEITYEDENSVIQTEYYANADEAKEYNNHTYQPACFTAVPPSQDNTTISDGKLTLSTVDDSWVLKVRNTTKRMKCTFVATINYEEGSTETIEEIETMSFTLVKARWNESTLEFNMLFDDRMNLQVPRDVATVLKVPELG